MNDQVTEDPQTILDRIQQQATRYETPCGDGKMEWCFSGITGEAQRYDRAFLQEIGEAIEKYETSGQ